MPLAVGARRIGEGGGISIVALLEHCFWICPRSVATLLLLYPCSSRLLPGAIHWLAALNGIPSNWHIIYLRKINITRNSTGHNVKGLQWKERISKTSPQWKKGSSFGRKQLIDIIKYICFMYAIWHRTEKHTTEHIIPMFSSKHGNGILKPLSINWIV